MSNIDDYLGGNKKRKVEPIDEDVNVSGKSEDGNVDDQPKAGNWDFLANMFGIAGGKKKEKSGVESTDSLDASAQEQDKEPDPPAARETRKPARASKPEATPKPSKPKAKKAAPAVADPVKALEDVANAPAEDKADILTQIFSAGFGGDDEVEEDEPEVAAVAEDSSDDSDDSEEPRGRRPRRRGGRKRKERTEEAAEDIVEDSGSEEEVSADDENFVEFEIQELDTSPILSLIHI